MAYKVHTISTVEGIGSVYEQYFIEKNIKYTEDLLTIPFSFLKRTFIENKMIFNKLNDFKTQAIFLQVTNDKQLAEAFCKAGIQGLAELACRKPETLVDIIDESIERGILNDSLDLSKAINIQKLAIETKYTGIFFGKIIDKNRKPIANADVYINHHHAVTDINGRYFIPRIEYGKRKIVIRARGYKTVMLHRTFEVNKLVRHIFCLNEGADDFAKNKLNTLNPGDKFESQQLELSDLNLGDQYYINYLYKNGMLGLKSIQQSKFDNIITTNKIKITAEHLNTSSFKLKDTFEWDGQTFKKLSKTFSELRLLTTKTIN